jgi:carboxypeptidase T
MHWAAVRAKDRVERTNLVNQGMSIESVVEDMSYGFATVEMLDSLKLQGVEVVSHFPANEIRSLDFPAEDAIYHNYAEMTEELQRLAAEYPRLVHLFSIGKTLEGRDILGVRLNPEVENAEAPTSLPGAIFMGGHHAREHLSMELPLRYARHLAEGYGKDSTITDLLNRRDIYFIPMVNADGAEFDISTGRYKSWRKNRKVNGGSCLGVDLNRNYGYQWGTGGSSNNPCSDVYMGTAPFSEPETMAIKTFVESKPNVKVLLSFHTFSELILYPWGHKYDPVENTRDRTTFEMMGRTMAGWNRYTPQSSSDLYIASGDTTDWAYGQLGIFAFTFELSPRDMWNGGFYPGAGAIERTFQANLRPLLYLIDLADDPYRAVAHPETTLFFGR